MRTRLREASTPSIRTKPPETSRATIRDNVRPISRRVVASTPAALIARFARRWSWRADLSRYERHGGDGVDSFDENALYLRLIYTH